MYKIYKNINITEDSMKPLILKEDIVLFCEIEFPKIKTNDILVVKKNQKFFIHRVIYKQEKFLIAKGDNNYYSDGKIYPKNIIGIVYKVKRGKHILRIEDLYLLQSTIYFKEIVKVKNTFEKEKIELVFLKGLPLHLYYEGQHPRRIYRDCDILVNKDQFSKAKRILSKIGYKMQIDELTPMNERNIDRLSEINFYKIINGITVIFDLHQEIVFMVQIAGSNSFYPQKLTDKLSKELLKEKEKALILGESIPILSLENMFIYTALHLYHHNFVGTFRYELMKIFFTKKDLDYGEIVKKIRLYRVENLVYPCFLFLKKYYKVKMPEILMEKIKPLNNKMKYINKILKDENIFDEGEKILSDNKRFENLFSLSPNIVY